MTAIATPPAPVDPAAPPPPEIPPPTAAPEAAVSSPPAPASPDKPDTPTPADPAKPTEITYALKLPEQSALPTDAIERTTALARKWGLSGEAAQEMLDYSHQEVSAAVAGTLASLAPGGAEWTKHVDGWTKQTLADPALGNTPAERRASIAKGQSVLAKYAEVAPDDATAFKGLLNETGWGSHPVTARFFAWLGASASEGQMIRPSAAASAPAKSLAEIFYPKGANRTEEQVRADGG